MAELGGSEGVPGASPVPFRQEVHCCWERCVAKQRSCRSQQAVQCWREGLLRDPTVSRALDLHCSADLGRVCH